MYLFLVNSNLHLHLKILSLPTFQELCFITYSLDPVSSLFISFYLKKIINSLPSRKRTGKRKQTCPSFHSSIFLFVSFSSLPSCMKLFMMNVPPHFQTTFKLTQSGFCTTTPCMVIIRDLLVPTCCSLFVLHPT